MESGEEVGWGLEGVGLGLGRGGDWIGMRVRSRVGRGSKGVEGAMEV